MKIIADIPDNIVDVYENHPRVTREILQENGISEYQAKIYSYLFRNGTINWDDAGDILKSVLLFDIHHPNHDLACMDAVNQFLADYQPDEIVYGGDQLSLDVVSTWNKNKPKLVEKERIKKDCEKFDKEVLKRHERICPDARRVFMYGNHEERLRWFVEQIPAVEGLVEVENVLQLQDRGYIVIPFNEVYRIGKLRVVHGFYWNVYHASKTAQAFESNVAYGHVHDHQTFTKISPVDRNDYHMATSIPCLSTLKPDYAKNKPNRYINGFGIVETSIETSNFNLTPVIINEGVFIHNGRIYSGN